jgi:hypothetical protein
LLQKYHSKVEIILTCIAVEGFLLYGMLSTVCEDTWQSTGVWWNYFLLGIYSIMAVKVILQKNNWIDWCMVISLAGLAEISRITTQTNGVVWFVAGLLLIKDIDLDKVLKVDLVTRICLGCALIALPLVGLYPDHTDQMIGGRLRSSFGWSHPNEMGLFFLILCILWFYIRYEKWNWKDMVAMIGAVLAVDHFANSRTSEICVVLLVGLSVLVCISRKYRWNMKKRCRTWGIAAASTLIVGCVGMLSLMTMVYSLSGWFQRFPYTVSSRLLLANRFWVDKGFTLFGQIFDNGTYGYLDIMYAHLGLNYGVIILLLFIGLNLFAIWQAYKDKNEKFLIILLIFITYSLLEHEHFKMLSGFYPVLLGYYVWPWLDSCRVRVEQRWNRRNGK